MKETIKLRIDRDVDHVVKGRDTWRWLIMVAIALVSPMAASWAAEKELTARFGETATWYIVTFGPPFLVLAAAMWIRWHYAGDTRERAHQMFQCHENERVALTQARDEASAAATYALPILPTNSQEFMLRMDPGQYVPNGVLHLAHFARLSEEYSIIFNSAIPALKRMRLRQLTCLEKVDSPATAILELGKKQTPALDG